MSTSCEVEKVNAALLSLYLQDELESGELGPTELKDYINSIKDWLKQRDPSPEDIQAMSEYKLTRITNQVKHITDLLREIDEIMDEPNIIHFLKALAIIPKISAIAYFQMHLGAAINTEKS